MLLFKKLFNALRSVVKAPQKSSLAQPSATPVFTNQVSQLTQYERFKLRMQAYDRERALRPKEDWLQPGLNRNKRAAKRYIGIEARRRKTIAKHLPALRLKQHQCLNTWGKLDRDQWKRICEEFVVSVLRPAKDGVEFWMKEVDERVGEPIRTVSKIASVDRGSELEMDVAKRLKSNGWNVQLLGQSGDQGGDLLAQKKGRVVVFQCKHYASKVGNSAVQEVIAARHYYNATEAVVIAPLGFTRQAQELAEKTMVALLRPEQLKRF